LFGYALQYWGLNWKKIPHRWGNTRTLKWTIRKRSLFRAGEGVDDIREGLWIFGKCWRRGYGIYTEKKGGVTRNQ